MKKPDVLRRVLVLLSVDSERISCKYSQISFPAYSTTALPSDRLQTAKSGNSDVSTKLGAIQSVSATSTINLWSGRLLLLRLVPYRKNRAPEPLQSPM